jgi:hypothetical protein
MQRNLWRALLFAMTVLLLGAVPALAQSEDDGVSLQTDSGSVMAGLRDDVVVEAGQTSEFVLVADGSARIEGAVGGLIAFDADVVVSGSGASVADMFTVGGTLTVDGGATIGDLAHSDTDLTGVTAGSISDERDVQTDLAGAAAWGAAALLIVLLFVWIGAGLAMLVSALLVVAFGTSQVRRAAFNIGNDVLKTLVVGLLMLIIPWIVIGLLAITIVGIPLAIGLAVLWFFAAFLGYITVGLWIGERILSRARSSARPYGAAFLGVLILMLLSWIPLVTPIALWFGVGSVSLAGWRVLRGGTVPPVPPGYGQPWGQPLQVPPPTYAPPPYAPPPPPPGQWPPQGGPPASWPQG